MKLQNSLPTLNPPLLCTETLLCYIFFSIQLKTEVLSWANPWWTGGNQSGFCDSGGKPVTPKVSTGFWLQNREAAAVLILIAVAQVSIRDFPLMEDFAQGFSPLAVFGDVLWWGYWGREVTVICLHKLSLLVWLFLLSSNTQADLWIITYVNFNSKTHWKEWKADKNLSWKPLTPRYGWEKKLSFRHPNYLQKIL